MTDSHFNPDPQTLDDCIAGLKVIGPGLGVYWRKLEELYAARTDEDGQEILGWLRNLHPIQNSIGYGLEWLLGQPDGAFGAGGSGKGPPPW